jgi:hypothetical protein
MKRMMVVMIGAVVISAVGMYAQAKPAAGSIFYGCVVPGGTSDSFKLINGMEKGQKTKDRVTYSLTPETPKVNIERFVTQEVEITGTASGTTLTVSKIKRRADYCG